MYDYPRKIGNIGGGKSFADLGREHKEAIVQETMAKTIAVFVSAVKMDFPLGSEDFGNIAADLQAASPLAPGHSALVDEFEAGEKNCPQYPAVDYWEGGVGITAEGKILPHIFIKHSDGEIAGCVPLNVQQLLKFCYWGLNTSKVWTDDDNLKIMIDKLCSHWIHKHCADEIAAERKAYLDEAKRLAKIERHQAVQSGREQGLKEASNKIKDLVKAATTTIPKERDALLERHSALIAEAFASG